MDGLSFIEKLSFNASYEGTRLPHCIKMHKRLSVVDMKKIGGDASYADDTNRELCTSNGIHTANLVELLGRIVLLKPAAG